MNLPIAIVKLLNPLEYSEAGIAEALKTVIDKVKEVIGPNFIGDAECKALDIDIETVVSNLDELLKMIEYKASSDPYICSMKQYIVNPLTYLRAEQIIRAHKSADSPGNPTPLNSLDASALAPTNSAAAKAPTNSAAAKAPIHTAVVNPTVLESLFAAYISEVNLSPACFFAIKQFVTWTQDRSKGR